jgi:hypothetical protein
MSGTRRRQNVTMGEGEWIFGWMDALVFSVLPSRSHSQSRAHAFAAAAAAAAAAADKSRQKLTTKRESS